MLSSASAEADSIVAAAKEEALFVRAEAEREAIRLTGDAKRDREEIVRVARAEAEQIIEAARQESDGVLAAASQQAELAQERARALEDRRSELLAELEATRASIGELESEIESRRLELEEPEEPEVVVEDIDDAPSHRTPDGGSVRIVAPTRVAPMRPVDAEELVAEVTALRARDDFEPIAAEPPVVPGLAAAESPTPAAEPSPSPALPDDDIPSVEEAASGAADDTETTESVTTIPEAMDVPAESSDRVRDEATGTPIVEVIAADQVDDADQAESGEESSHEDVSVEEEQPRGEGADEIAVIPVAPPDVPAETNAAGTDPPPDGIESADAGPDDLGSLFAQLRDTPPSDPAPHAVDERSGDQARPAHDQEVSAPQEEGSDPAPAPETAERVSSPSESGPDSDGAAQLIPIQNAALRSIKRTLVDLQNDALEHLRIDDDWMPDESFMDKFDEPFAELTLVVTGEVDSAVASAFGTDLYDAVSSAMERSREAGAGERELAAATSKVFRTWRSDEAERRVADVASTHFS